ncbi:MAG: hypothetical protein AAGM22_24795 [Acidobacteriota bacterium]
MLNAITFRHLGLGLAAVLFLIGGVAVIPAAAAGDLEGRFDAELHGDRLWLRLQMGRSLNFGSSWPARSFRDLGQGRAELRREAGVFRFQNLRPSAEGKQSGVFSFRPDPAYVEALAKRGFSDVGSRKLLELACLDLTLGFIDDLAELGYRESLERLVEMRIHGVDGRYIRELANAGYRELPSKKLVEMRIHGVDGAYVREIGDAGFRDLSAQKLVEMRIHGVDGPFLAALKGAGYGEVPMRRILEMRIHGVEPTWIDQLAALGYRELTAQKLVEMRIHGVSPTWIRELQELGYGSDVVSARQLVEMRIHGVDPGWIRSLGKPTMSPRELIERRIHGG